MKSLLITTLLFLFTNAFCQDKRHFIIHAGAVIPSGEFSGSDKMNEKSLAAGLGAGLNVEFVQPLKVKGLGIYGSIGFNYNGLKSNAKDGLESEGISYLAKGIGDQNSNNLIENENSFPKYFSIPVSTGVNYKFYNSEKISLFGNLGLVANFFKTTEFTYIKNYSGLKTENYKTPITFGVKIGGGIIFYDRIYVSLNYTELGKQKIEGEYSATDLIGNQVVSTGEGNFSIEPRISYLNLSLGVRL